MFEIIDMWELLKGWTPLSKGDGRLDLFCFTKILTVWLTKCTIFQLYHISNLKVVLNGHDQDHSKTGFLFVLLQILMK